MVSILYTCLASYDLPLSSSVANSSVRKVAEELTAAPVVSNNIKVARRVWKDGQI